MSDKTIAEFVCDDWAHFRRTLEEKVYKKGSFVAGEFLYRGQSSASYRLETSFDRWYQGPKARRPSVSDQLLYAFGNECEGHGDAKREVLDDEDRLLALAQHHGLPARLLDWTVSPYVAAFFAFSYAFDADVALEDYVAVWALDASSEIWTKDSGAYWILRSMATRECGARAVDSRISSACLTVLRTTCSTSNTLTR